MQVDHNLGLGVLASSSAARSRLFLLMSPDLQLSAYFSQREVHLSSHLADQCA